MESRSEWGGPVHPEDARHHLAEFDQRLRSGAESTAPRLRLVHVAGAVAVVAYGGREDVPPSWHWLLTLVQLTMPVVLVVLVARRRTRPLPVRMTRQTWALLAVTAVVGLAILLGAGPVLRDLGVPLPFTLGSLCAALLVSAVAYGIQRRQGGGYVSRVTTGQW